MAIKTSGRFTATVRVPFTGKGSAVLDETLVMPGVTQGTDQGLAIPVPVANAGADTLGILKGAHATADDSLQTGATWSYRTVELIDAVQLCEFEYSQGSSDVMSVASTSTTTVTVTSLENNIDGSWLYATAGTGAGLLAFVTASAAGSCTTMSTTGWDSTTKLIKIFRFGHKLFNLTSASKLKTAAAVGVFTGFNFENYIDHPTVGKVLLNPTKHNNVNFGTAIPAKFTSRIAIRSNAGR